MSVYLCTKPKVFYTDKQDISISHICMFFYTDKQDISIPYICRFSTQINSAKPTYVWYCNVLFICVEKPTYVWY
jgi:hypothetical protein